MDIAHSQVSNLKDIIKQCGCFFCTYHPAPKDLFLLYFYTISCKLPSLAWCTSSYLLFVCFLLLFQWYRMFDLFLFLGISLYIRIFFSCFLLLCLSNSIWRCLFCPSSSKMVCFSFATDLHPLVSSYFCHPPKRWFPNLISRNVLLLPHLIDRLFFRRSAPENIFCLDGHQIQEKATANKPSCVQSKKPTEAE